MRVLVIEDDVATLKAIEKTLSKAGYDVETAQFGVEGSQMAQSQPFDCIVTDLGLPDVNGLDVIHSLRELTILTPLLILSAENSVQTKIDGLRNGADDYLTKPFEANELVARVQAIIRRATHYAIKLDGDLVFGSIKLDKVSRVLTIGDVVKDLSNHEFELLRFFMENPSQVLEKSLISERVWKIDFNTHTNFVNVYVSYLRRMFEDAGLAGMDIIETIRKRGFKFNPPI